MSQAPAAAGAARWASSLAGRIARAWRVLPPERRLAGGACVGLFVTLFLPWYHETVVVATGAKHPPAASATVTGWGAFSFVEAAVLLVAVSVLVLLVQRAEGHAFHLPGGDGLVVTAAAVWTSVLVIWRIFDKQGTDIHGQGVAISGIEWGIFFALAMAGLLAYAGSRIRAAHVPEPPLPGEDGPPEPAVTHTPLVRRGSRRARPVGAAGSGAERTGGGDGGAGRAGGAERSGGVGGGATAAAKRAAAAGREGHSRGGGTAAVDPDDPPTMRYDERPTRRRARALPDDQLTIPLEREE